MGGVNNLRNIIGQRFGYLTAIRHIPRYGSERKRGGNALWLCQCDCGERVKAGSDKLITGRKKSCGVSGHRWVPQRPAGQVRTYPSEYRSWKKMHERCSNPRHERYSAYGGRGIWVCDRWHSFRDFMEDMGPKPNSKYTIERRDNDGPYTKDNCRWATRAEQSRNMRNSVYVEFRGKRELLMDVCEWMGVSRGLVYGRIKSGWDAERAVTTPVPHRLTCPDCGKVVRVGARHTCGPKEKRDAG